MGALHQQPEPEEAIVAVLAAVRKHADHLKDQFDKSMALGSPYRCRGTAGAL